MVTVFYITDIDVIYLYIHILLKDSLNQETYCKDFYFLFDCVVLCFTMILLQVGIQMKMS